ncbi:ZapG family protein [Ningiella sp. W23]|uniref:ZapG family protein n=1 Tax=Ningiella sp. W23 TaxID=3023715 RepID=UPI0037571CFB
MFNDQGKAFPRGRKMDLLSIVLGIIIGLSVGSIVAWNLSAASSKKKSSQLSRSEQELKVMLSQQAQHHLDSTREAIEAIQLRLDQVTQNMQHYEASLQLGEDETQGTSFFGEHASLFLRNNKTTKISGDRNKIGDAPPRDFANKSSGLFVGNVAEDESANK